MVLDDVAPVDLGTADARELKNSPEFTDKREEILSLIWEMEEQIMGTGV